MSSLGRLWFDRPVRSKQLHLLTGLPRSHPTKSHEERSDTGSRPSVNRWRMRSASHRLKGDAAVTVLRRGPCRKVVTAQTGEDTVLEGQIHFADGESGL